MAFSVVTKGFEPPVWCSTDGSSTYYIGQIVTTIAASKANIVNGAVSPLAVPAGVADTTNFQIPFGVVVGLNKYYDAQGTYGTADTGVLTQANQKLRSFAGVEGMYVKSDPQVMIQVERIFPHTILRGNIYNAALGTAPTLLTTTAASATGFNSAGTTNACEFTPIADMGTIYCRTGANAGLYRITHDTSTTAPQCPLNFPSAIAIGDTFIRTPMRQGYSEVYIGGSDVPGMYVNNALTALNNFTILVNRLGLETAGQEYVEFSFCLDHFCSKRA